MFTRFAVIAALLLAIAPNAQGQQVENRTWDLRLASGGLITTGKQRDQLENGQLSAIQLSRTLGSSFAITGTFGWAVATT